MTNSKSRKRRIRALAAELEISYTAAMRVLDAHDKPPGSVNATHHRRFDPSREALVPAPDARDEHNLAAQVHTYLQARLPGMSFRAAGDIDELNVGLNLAGPSVASFTPWMDTLDVQAIGVSEGAQSMEMTVLGDLVWQGSIAASAAEALVANGQAKYTDREGIAEDVRLTVRASHAVTATLLGELRPATGLVNDLVLAHLSLK